jgi:hypothetical protein
MATAPALISPLISIAQNASKSDVPPEDKTEGSKFSNPMDDYLRSQAEYNKALQTAADSLTNRNPTNYFSIGAQFLKPTMTGSFGESLANAAGEAGRQQEQERLNAPAIAQMRAQIAKQQMDTTKGSIIKTASRSIFTPIETKGADGKTKTTYKINTGAINDIMRFSDNPIKDLADYATAIPKLRASGMLGETSTSGTPFDALALMAPNDLIKKRAEYLAQQYKSGALDPDKAEIMANQMVTMSTSSMDRQTALDFKAMIAGMMVDIKKEASLKTLTDEQKIKFNKVVVPIINESAKANTALTMLDQIQETIGKAPSGVLQGAYAKSVGALFGTDDNTALRQLESMSKALLPQVPRLPGAASNLDAKNIEKGLGELQDIKLTNAQRVEILGRIRKSFENLAERGFEIQTYWDTNKDIHPMVTNRKAGETTPAGAPTTPTATPASKPQEKAPQAVRYIGTRAIIPNANNTGWVYKDNGLPVQ